MTELPINQKEYLKKYLALGKAPGEKKKKKKKPVSVQRVQIIDDNEVDPSISSKTGGITAEDIICINDNEDAPQIVAIIDERPPSMRFDEKTKNPLWQPIGTVNAHDENEQKQMMKGFKIQAKGYDKLLIKSEKSPSRRQKHSHRESPITIKEEPKDDEEIPPKSIENESSTLTPKRSDNENSPPRRKKVNDDNSPPRRENDGDNSPPRRRKGDDSSPPRRKKEDNDTSPPRRRRNDDTSPPRRKSRFDSSPPRRKTDTSVPRKTKNKNDNSPPRKRMYIPSPIRRSELDSSPVRGNRYKDKRRNEKYYRDDRRAHYSQSRRDKREEKEYSSDNRNKKMDKTLDGKTAGLQNARELIQETQNHKTREDKLFQTLGTDVSGQNAGTVHRDRKTGRIRNLEEEGERQREKQEEEAKNKEKYERWGRGIAQIESREAKIKEQLHEMSKPLARYADDKDLEKFLKEQERDGDPMLAYLRKKRRAQAAERGEEIKPSFEGEFMPNRYGIRPGHRWDGVDRSNGYEKKWFEVQNQMHAQQEDIYKWSTEDM